MSSSGAVLLFSCAALLAIAWLDYQTLRIRNVHVFGLGFIYLLYGIASNWQSLPGDALAGVLLFLIGFVLWLARLQGGGDVKLAFMIGLFIGFGALPGYALLLLIATVALYLLLRLGRRHSKAGSRLFELSQGGQAPFSLPMIAAALPIILSRALDI